MNMILNYLAKKHLKFLYFQFQNAEPKPNFAWYLDGKLLDWNTDKIRYTAKLIDSGKRLSCDIFQVDDEKNYLNKTVSTLLKINENPLPTNGMSVEIISGK